MDNNQVLNLVKASIWGSKAAPDIQVSETVFNEMKAHSIAALPAYILSTMELSDELREKWKNYILQTISFNCNYMHEQEKIPLSIPYAVLKGSAAAQYYPHPLLRAMGDIDLITSRDTFLYACEELIQNGYSEVTSFNENEYGRHRTFIKNGITLEMHSFFALLNDKDKSKYLDDLIISNINESHVLPDLVNGLVLLEHINQHLERGLGLRQIIDWMMFVHKHLPDEKWDDFQKLVGNTGLKTLAITVTKMCEMYLGLLPRKWSSNADESLSSELLNYLMESGNFGIKLKQNDDIELNVFLSARTPKVAFRLLKERGLANWKAAQKHNYLRRFAWLYQLWRYFYKGFCRKYGRSKVKRNYYRAKKRNELFDALGIKRGSNGIVIYKNGEYIKTDKNL